MSAPKRSRQPELDRSRVSAVRGQGQNPTFFPSPCTQGDGWGEGSCELAKTFGHAPKRDGSKDFYAAPCLGVTVKIMTKLLEKAVANARELPAAEQNASAQIVIDEIESERRWNELLAELAADGCGSTLER